MIKELGKKYNVVKLTQLAAMFGLDARIALIIFGTLSVFSGALLFDSLDEVDSTALLADMNTAAKAYEQYYLHTRKELPMIDQINFNSAALVDSTIENNPKWRGPYLQYPLHKLGSAVINTNLRPSMYGADILYTKAKKSAWSSMLTPSLQCSSKTDCAVWVRFDYIDEELANAFELLVDDSLNSLDGNVRQEVSSASSDRRNVYYYVKRTKDIRQGVCIYC